MTERFENKRISGFTLIETLLVIVILVILLGLSLVGVAYYRDYLKITELDNEAREIFMAAENRAVLLQNSGESVSLLGEKTEGAVVTLSNRAEADRASLAGLLPEGVIDPALREGHFLVLYDAGTHHVTEVFYAEKGKDIDGNLKDFHDKSRTERVLLFRGGRTLVGWYGGGKAENIGTKPLPTPGVEVLIENGEELTLKVKFIKPDGKLPDDIVYTPKIELDYQGAKVPLLKDNLSNYLNRFPSNDDGDFGTGNYITYTWVLDSLAKDAGGYSQQFKDLKSDLPELGKNFTVTASLKLTAGDDWIPSSYFAQDTDNSLFARETENGPIACIANLRHLQNLHMDFSDVGVSITKAEQLVDIDCEKYKNNQGTVLDPAYNFIPIVNGALASDPSAFDPAYDGQQKTIRNLYVACPGNAGLFGFVTNDVILANIRLDSPSVTSTGTDEAVEATAAPLLARVDEGKCTLENIEVINGSANGKTYAGGLVGLINSDASCSLENCRVYWDAPKKLQVEGSTPRQMKYVVSGNCAGGLIGYASGDTHIKASFASTTVKGAAQSGGLAGLTGTKPLNVSGSYADCYLAGNSMTGGLIGESQSAPSLTSCYAAGFIMPGSAHTAGLAGGTGANAANCYSAVRVILGDGSLESPATPLYGSVGNGSGSVLYLSTAAEATADLFGSAFEYDSKKPETHPYNLRRWLSGAEELKPPYPFPGLNGLPHYGDWAELDSIPAGLVYYEIYDDGTTGVSGITEDGAPFDTLKEIPPVQDGYALIIKKEDAGSLNRVLIKYEGQNWRLKRAGQSQNWMWHPSNGDPKFEPISGTDTLLLLPEDIVTGELPNSGRFYQELVVGEGQDAVTYWFNPHFAKTVHTGKTVPGSPTSSDNPVYVRTPRHLYDLSCFYFNFKNYYVSRKAYFFRQELDLNYATYLWYGSNRPDAPEAGSGSTTYKQLPIGDSGADYTFRGTYDGGCHKIKNVFFKVELRDKDNELVHRNTHLGLFGHASDNSCLKNIVYELDPKSVEEVSYTHAVGSCGALLGQLQGARMENCAVYGVNMHISGVDLTQCGGLVGFNNTGGVITGCSAEVVSLEVENCWAGGLAGSSGGDVINSYAVGKIVSNKHAGGLINESDNGTITNCYAAVWVEAEVRRGLCNCNQPQNIDENSGFLTGAFKYRGEMYIVDSKYVGAGERILPADLAKKIKVLSEASVTDPYDISGETWESDYKGDGKEDFPYRTGVKDAGSQPVHYGLWPVEYMPPAGLAYYETYSDGTSGVSGQYENTKIMSLKTETVFKDGYALVFDGEFPAGDYAVKYGNPGHEQSWKLTKTGEGKYVWSGPEATQEVWAIKKDIYTLIPLPDKIVTGELSEGDVIGAKFCQRLVYGEGLLHTRTFYFNPHFAGRIKEGELVSVEAGSVKSNAAYTPPKVPVEPLSSSGGDGSITVWAGTCTNVDNAWGWRAVSVRTARHFYALSRFQNTYVVEGSSAKRYYFKQALDVDYNTYNWYGLETPAKHSSDAYYVQVPIGQGVRDSDGFKGAYNGGGHTIENVFYTTSSAQESSYPLSPKAKYVGLFRYVEYISNVNYKAPSSIEVTVVNDVDHTSQNGNSTSSDLEIGAKVGTLIGGCFRSSHCNATLQDFTVNCSAGDKSDHIYIGGLSGYSNKMNGCSVVINGQLKYQGNVQTVCVGGLQALVYQEVVNCTSKVGSLVVKGTGNSSQTVYAGGLLGGIAHDDAKSMTRTVAGCATEIRDLHVESSGTSYAGGLIGHNCEGGRIYSSYAVGAIGFDGRNTKTADPNEKHHYSGLVGRNENASSYKITIKNCYSAVGLPDGSQNRNHNFCPDNPGTITNCFYLTGNWRYGGIQYTALTDTTTYAAGKTYDDLAELTLPAFSNSHGTVSNRQTWYDIPVMKAAGGTGYPFPVNTGDMVVRYLNGSGGEDGRYQNAFLPYPGGDWPVK